LSPGDLLRDVLRGRNMSQAQLAGRMGRPPQVISEIVTAKKAITGQTAVDLERALGIPAEVWLASEATYRLRQTRAAQ
jgi:HTH-type transcriptional regulator / antitoxin HigA